MTAYTDKTGVPVTVERDPVREAYEIRDATGEVAGHAHFRERDGERIFHHTVIDERFGGRGLGTALVRGAVEGTRDEGLPVVAECSMVRGFLEKNDEEFSGAYRLSTPEDRAWLQDGNA